MRNSSTFVNVWSWKLDIANMDGVIQEKDKF